MPLQAFGWWRAAHGVASALTTPRIAVAESDWIVERELRNGALAAIVRRAVAPIEAAMQESIARSMTRQVTVALLSLTLSARVRATGCVIVVAAVTVLLLDAAKPAPAAPLLWIVPVSACAIGALVALASDAIARALAARST